jgi:hypothetical protein
LKVLTNEQRGVLNVVSMGLLQAVHAEILQTKSVLNHANGVSMILTQYRKCFQLTA